MQVPAAWKNHTLQELQIREKYRLNVIGIRKKDVLEVTIDPKRRLDGDAVLIVVGENEALKQFQD